ncbi:hypothetical protein B0A48_12001 [Cryoendolithus antarcticus]|uniref:Uncharacterized protein n=1 Tax=Cryoendolithus antarcticus TaxID=1507870 RepID=A0A1V8STU8_9PEZI|nr:hypothetical protein B0A48_12001 [Cryoendolithus antarcticus]
MPDRLGGIVGHINSLCDHIGQVQSRIASDDAQIASLRAKLERVTAQRARHHQRLGDLKQKLQTAGALLAAPDDAASQTLIDQPLGAISDLSADDDDDDGPDEVPATRAPPVARMRAPSTSPAVAAPVVGSAGRTADSATVSPRLPPAPFKPFVRNSPDVRASTTPHPKKTASPPTKLIQPRQIHPDWPTVVHFNNTWVELTCLWCGANSKGKGKGVPPTFFNGARGLKRHCGAHVEGLGQCEVTEFCSMRVVSARDVNLIEHGRPAEESAVVHIPVLAGGVTGGKPKGKRSSEPLPTTSKPPRDSSGLFVTPRTTQSLRDRGFAPDDDIEDDDQDARPATATANGSGLKRKRTTNEYFPRISQQSQDDVDLAMRPPPVPDDPMDASWQPSMPSLGSTADIKYEEGMASSGDEEYEDR